MVCSSISSIALQLFCNGRNPDGSETHALNIIKLMILESPSNNVTALLTWFIMPCHDPPQYSYFSCYIRTQ